MSTALHSPWWPRLAALAAAVWLAAALARLLWLVLSGPALPVSGGLPSGSPSVGAAASPPAPLAQWHLFGDAAPPVAADVQAPETALRLFLRGTLNADVEGQGIAIIADAEGGERAYRVGDALPGGAELTAVHAGRVLLRRDGSTEQLSLPREAAEVAAAGASSQPSAARGNGMASPPPGRIHGLINPGGGSFVNPVISTGGPQIDAATRAMLPDLETLAQQVNVLPVIENGRVAGVRLAAGRDSQLLARSGIRPTDVVTAVNGIPLDGLQRQEQLMDILKAGGSVRVTVRRDGRESQLTVDLR